jgi:hypothetical protein
MDPSVFLEWLEIAEWLALDDRLRRAIIASDALRRAGRSRHVAGIDGRLPVNSENLDSGSAGAAFRLPGRGVF